MIELLPTPLSPRRTILYLILSRLLLSSDLCMAIIIIFGELMQEESFSIQALVFLLNLAIYVLASYFIQKFRVSFLHESTIAIFLGILTAVMLKYGFQKEIKFSDEYFFALLLPPIVFSVGYGIKKPHFFQNIGMIIFLGTISTIISICLFTLLLIAINQTFLGTLTSKDILLISTVISSIDPIAALPLIKTSHAKLNAVASGESVVNSAVVIILFGTVNKIDSTSQQYSVGFIINILVSFAYLFVFSLLLGMIFGFTLSFLFKKIQSFSHQPIKQSSLILLIGYMVYLLGQFSGLSGVIALFTCAIIFSMYGFQNLSTEAKHGTILAFETVKYISQAFIFAYLGASLLTTSAQASAIGLSILVIVSIPIIRLLSIILLPLIHKIIKKTFPMSMAERKMLWYCGLMRGVIAFALSLQIQSENRTFMITISLFVVMFTTISTATLLKSFSEWIGLTEIGIIRFGDIKEEEKHIELMPATKYSVIGDHQEGKENRQPQRQSFKTFEEKFIKPIFTKPTDKQRLSNVKIHIQT